MPNLCGVCVLAPPLDDIGNSVRASEFCKRLKNRLPIALLVSDLSSFFVSIRTEHYVLLFLLCMNDVQDVIFDAAVEKQSAAAAAAVEK